VSQEKTEKPTRRRLKDARKRGQSARSAEAAQAAGLLAIVAVLPGAVSRLRDVMVGSFYDSFQVASQHDDAVATQFFRRTLIDGGRALVPAVAVIGISSLVVQFAIVGGAPNMQALKPKFERINLMKGLKRIFSKQLLWDFSKSGLKLGAVVIVLVATWGDLRDRFFAGVMSIPDFIAMLGGGIDMMIARVAALGLVVAAVDVIVARRRYRKGVRMTKQEVRDEMRHSEGDPHMKGEVKRRMFKMSRMRMMADVARATVVLTNPTHYAIALRYTDDDAAPVVVAKGAGEIAQRIKAEAAAHNVPMVENKPLTRALYRATDIGDTIPADFYQAIAEVFAVLWRTRKAA
jgi:flagellar biosynthesis protein FlhB